MLPFVTVCLSEARIDLIRVCDVTLCNLWPFDLKERKHFRGIMTLQITDVKKLIFTPVIFMIIARHNYGLSCFSWEPWPGCPDWLLWPERRTKPGPGTLRCRDQECGEMRREREGRGLRSLVQVLVFSRQGGRIHRQRGISCRILFTFV